MSIVGDIRYNVRILSLRKLADTAVARKENDTATAYKRKGDGVQLRWPGRQQAGRQAADPTDGQDYTIPQEPRSSSCIERTVLLPERRSVRRANIRGTAGHSA